MRESKIYMMGGVPQRLYGPQSPEALEQMRVSYRKPAFSEAQQHRIAREYAEWVAAKQGLKIEELGYARAIHGYVGKQKRVQAVKFGYGSDAPVIQIPHWNHVPEVVEVEAVELPMAA